MSVLGAVPPATKPDSPSWMATPNPPSLTGAEFSFEASSTQWGCGGKKAVETVTIYSLSSLSRPPPRHNAKHKQPHLKMSHSMHYFTMRKCMSISCSTIKPVIQRYQQDEPLIKICVTQITIKQTAKWRLHRFTWARVTPTVFRVEIVPPE